jgi:tripartite-type tricarboxylate transporter receptor subunit TctC
MTPMKLPRRSFLRLAVGAAALPAVSRVAWAQAYPTRPVRLIVGYPPGTTPDILARLMSQWLSERFGQPFVIENRPGASSNIATESVARAPADGHTLLLITAPNAINATLYEKLNFDLVRDIAAVSGVTRAPLVVEVSPSFAARTVPELIANARTNPGKVSIATAGTASVSHLTVELLKMRAGIDIVRVPYPSAASAIPDVIADRVHAVVDPIVSSIEHIRAGRPRPLAVTTTIRSEALPDVPVMADFLPGYEASAWAGFGAPKNTSVQVIDKLNKEINAALADAKIKARLADLGGMMLPGSPADFRKFIADEIEKWGQAIRAANIKAE